MILHIVVPIFIIHLSKDVEVNMILQNHGSILLSVPADVGANIIFQKVVLIGSSLVQLVRASC